jgi:hypothetical protein
MRISAIASALCLSSIVMVGVTALCDTLIMDLPDGVTYEQATSEIRRPVPTTFNQHFSNLNFETLEGYNETVPTNALSWLSEIYLAKNYDKDDSRVIFAKFNVNVTGPIQYGTVYRMSKGYLAHYKMGGVSAVLFFRGFSSGDIQTYNSEILRVLEKSKKDKTAFNFRHFLGSLIEESASAETNESQICGASLNGETPKTSSSALAQIWRCSYFRC